MTIERCPFIPGLAELFETPLPKISFPKESEKKVYLYCELIQRNRKKNEEQESTRQDDKKTENKKAEIVNKEKKKTKNRKKKKKNNVGTAKQPSLTNLNIEGSTESEAVEEDPTLILPERKITNMHKWPSRLSAPKVEPRIKTINNNDSNVISVKDKIATTNSKITEAGSSYDLLGSLLGDKNSPQNTAESNDLIGSLLKGKISSFNSDSLKAVGYDSPVCKVKHDDGSKNENKRNISKTLQNETDEGPKRELPLPKTVKSETVKCEKNVKPVSHVSVDGTSEISSRAISEDSSCDLIGSSLDNPKSSSFTNTPEASDSDSNEDLGYDLSICIENEDEDDGRTVKGNEQMCPDDKKSGVYQSNKQEVSTSDTNTPSKSGACIQKRKEVDICHMSISKPQADLKKCVTKRKKPGQTSKGLLHSMKTLKQRTSLSAKKSTPLVLKTKSMETSKDEKNKKTRKSSLSIPKDTCEKGSSKNIAVSNADSRNAVSSSTGKINDKCNSFDYNKVEHTNESVNYSKHANNRQIVNTVTSNSVTSSNGNLSSVVKNELQHEKVRPSVGNQVTTGKRTSSLFDEIITEQSVKRSRTSSNENLNSINNSTSIENKNSKDTPQCKKEGNISDAPARKRKQPVKRSSNESRQTVADVSSDKKMSTEENDVSRSSQCPGDAQRNNFDQENDKSDGKQDYNDAGNQYYKTIDYNHKRLVAPDGGHGHLGEHEHHGKHRLDGRHSSQRDKRGESESYRNDQYNQNEEERGSKEHAGNGAHSRNLPNTERGRRNTRSMSRRQQYEGSQNRPESPRLDLVAGAPMRTEVAQGSSEARKRSDGNIKDRRYQPKGHKKSNSYWEKRQLERQREREKREYDAQQPCVYYKTHGKCKYGDDCRFSHDIEVDEKYECCKYYVAGACNKGDNCLFIHGDWPCKFYHIKGYCNSTDCRFSHAEMTPKMKEVFEARIQLEESMEKAAEEVEKVQPIVEPPTECSYPTEFVTRVDPVPNTECKSEGSADKPNAPAEEPKKIEDFQFPSLYYELT